MFTEKGKLILPQLMWFKKKKERWGRKKKRWRIYREEKSKLGFATF